MSCHPVARPEDEASAPHIARSRSLARPIPARPLSYNRLTGLRQKVGNFPGVTVEHHTRLPSATADGEEVALIDLPGIYSLTPKSEDERVAVDVLQGKMPGMARPDAVIVVLNSNNLHTPPGAGRTRDRARPADAGAAEHGRRTAQAGRRRRRAGAGARTGTLRSHWSAR